MHISITSFQEEGQAIRQIRSSVFVKEQGIPNEDEYDYSDNVCVCTQSPGMRAGQ